MNYSRTIVFKILIYISHSKFIPPQVNYLYTHILLKETIKRQLINEKPGIALQNTRITRSKVKVTYKYRERTNPIGERVNSQRETRVYRGFINIIEPSTRSLWIRSHRRASERLEQRNAHASTGVGAA